MVLRVLRNSGGVDGFGKLGVYLSRAEDTRWEMVSEAIIDRSTALVEMIASSTLRPKVVKPCAHVILSWAPEDRPSDEAMQEVTRKTLDFLGGSEHQWLAISHRDTPHAHAHIVLNTVTPDGASALDLSQTFMRRQSYLREIEREYGLASGIERQVEPDMANAMMGCRTLRRWAKVVLSERLEHFFEHTPTWDGLHGMLAEYGLLYQATERGGVIRDISTDAPKPVRASSIHRLLGASNLAASLGTYSALPFEIDPREHGSAYERFRRERIALQPSLDEKYDAVVTATVQTRRTANARVRERRAAHQTVREREHDLRAQVNTGQITPTEALSELVALPAPQPDSYERRRYRRRPRKRNFVVRLARDGDAEALALLHAYGLDLGLEIRPQVPAPTQALS